MATLVKDKGLIACKKCSAIIRYSPDDIRSVVVNKDIYGNKAACKYLICPGCGDDISISYFEINEEESR